MVKKNFAFRLIFLVFAMSAAFAQVYEVDGLSIEERDTYDYYYDYVFEHSLNNKASQSSWTRDNKEVSSPLNIASASSFFLNSEFTDFYFDCEVRTGNVYLLSSGATFHIDADFRANLLQVSRGATVEVGAPVNLTSLNVLAGGKVVLKSGGSLNVENFKLGGEFSFSDTGAMFDVSGTFQTRDGAAFSGSGSLSCRLWRNDAPSIGFDSVSLQVAGSDSDGKKRGFYSSCDCNLSGAGVFSSKYALVKGAKAVFSGFLFSSRGELDIESGASFDAYGCKHCEALGLRNAGSAYFDEISALVLCGENSGSLYLDGATATLGSSSESFENSGTIQAFGTNFSDMNFSAKSGSFFQIDPNTIFPLAPTISQDPNSTVVFCGAVSSLSNWNGGAFANLSLVSGNFFSRGTGGSKWEFARGNCVSAITVGGNLKIDVCDSSGTGQDLALAGANIFGKNSNVELGRGNYVTIASAAGQGYRISKNPSHSKIASLTLSPADEARQIVSDDLDVDNLLLKNGDFDLTVSTNLANVVTDASEKCKNVKIDVSSDIAVGEAQINGTTKTGFAVSAGLEIVCGGKIAVKGAEICGVSQVFDGIVSLAGGVEFDADGGTISFKENVAASSSFGASDAVEFQGKVIFAENCASFDIGGGSKGNVSFPFGIEFRQNENFALKSKQIRFLGQSAAYSHKNLEISAENLAIEGNFGDILNANATRFGKISFSSLSIDILGNCNLVASESNVEKSSPSIDFGGSVVNVAAGAALCLVGTAKSDGEISNEGSISCGAGNFFAKITGNGEVVFSRAMRHFECAGDFSAGALRAEGEYANSPKILFNQSESGSAASIENLANSSLKTTGEISLGNDDADSFSVGNASEFEIPSSSAAIFFAGTMSFPAGSLTCRRAATLLANTTITAEKIELDGETTCASGKTIDFTVQNFDAFVALKKIAVTGDFSQTGAGKSVLAGGIEAGAGKNIVFSGDVVLSASCVFCAANGKINFGGEVLCESLDCDLTCDTGESGGNVSFNGLLDSAPYVKNLSIISGEISFLSAGDIAIVTSGGQNYGGKLECAANLTLKKSQTSSAGALSFKTGELSVGAGKNLTLSNWNQALAFASPIGAEGSPIGSLALKFEGESSVAPNFEYVFAEDVFCNSISLDFSNCRTDSGKSKIEFDGNLRASSFSCAGDVFFGLAFGAGSGAQSTEIGGGLNFASLKNGAKIIIGNAAGDSCRFSGLSVGDGTLGAVSLSGVVDAQSGDFIPKNAKIEIPFSAELCAQKIQFDKDAVGASGASLKIQNGGEFSFAGAISADGGFEQTGAKILAASASSKILSENGEIKIESDISGASSGCCLALSAKKIQLAMSSLQNLAKFSAAASEGDIFFESDSKTTISAASQTYGCKSIASQCEIDFDGNVALAAATNFSSSGKNLTFRGEVSGASGIGFGGCGTVYFEKNVNLSTGGAQNVLAGDFSFGANSKSVFCSGGIDFQLGEVSAASSSLKVESRGQISISSDFNSAELTFSAANDNWILGAAAFSGKVFFEGNLFVDSESGAVSFNSDVSVSKNAVFASASQVDFASGKSFSAGEDFVAMSGGVSANDDGASADGEHSGVSGLFSYLNPARDGAQAASPSLQKFPEKIASKAAFGAKKICGNGAIVSAGKNFYINGTEISSFTLRIPDNDSAKSAFAEAFNAKISGILVECANSGGTAFLAAAENCEDGGSNNFGEKEGVAFSRTRLSESGVYSISDCVVRIAIEGGKFENSCGEISKAAAHIRFSNGEQAFSGAFLDAECTASTDGAGDLEFFFLKSPQTWNTDASGTSAGSDESADFGGSHKNFSLDLQIPKATSEVFQVLRDNAKNRLANYVGGSRFLDAKDKCPPVVVKIRTGQELHKLNESKTASKEPYDAHNFVEIQYSEPVSIKNSAGDDIFSAADKNIQVSADLGGTSSHGGGVKFAGLFSAAQGEIGCQPDGLVHSFYREFSLGNEDSKVHPCRMRVGIAAYDSGERNWEGFLDSLSVVSGAAEIDKNPNVADLQGNLLVVFGDVEISNEHEDGTLYGGWDCSPPVFAPFLHRKDSEFDWDDYDWANPLAEGQTNEIIAHPQDGTVCFDIHFFDNAPQDFADLDESAKWVSNEGWFLRSLLETSAMEDRGGARPFAGDGMRTFGGVRFCTVDAANFSCQKEEVPLGAFVGLSPKATMTDFFRNPQNGGIEANEIDGPYLQLKMAEGTSADFDFFGQYVIAISNSRITDLAGNRIQGSLFARTVPRDFATILLTVAAGNGNEVLVFFDRPMKTQTNRNPFTGEGEAFNLLAQFPKELEIVDSRTMKVVEGAIDEESCAKCVVENSKSSAFSFSLKTTLTAEQALNYYIRVKKPAEDRFEDMTGQQGRYTCIVSKDGNPMPYYSDDEVLPSEYEYAILEKQFRATQHCIADFSAGFLNLLYATDGAFVADSPDGRQSGALRKFDGTGKLFEKTDWSFVANMGASADEGFDVSMFADANVGSDFVWKDLNAKIGLEQTIWTPKIEKTWQDFAASPNELAKSVLAESIGGGLKNFALCNNSLSLGWKSGDKVQFLFQIKNPQEPPENPQGKALYRECLFDFRLSNQGDLSSFCLWEFSVVDFIRQRGGISVFRNVVNVDAGDFAIVEVVPPYSGQVTVSVMSVDGSLVKRLHKGFVAQGEGKYLRWDGRNGNGRPVARGIYFVRAVGKGIDETRKIMVVRD